MHDDMDARIAPPPSGGLIRLQARAADLGSWLGPAWATLCGVLASGAFQGQRRDYVKLLLLLFLVDAGWGTIWSALAGTDWALALARWQTWDKNTPAATLPYTRPGTYGDRISHWVGKLSTWWRMVFWPACGSAVRALLVTLPLTALLALLLGPELLLLSIAAAALMQLGVFWEGGRGVVPPAWDGFIAVTLPWLAGHVVFGTVTLASATLATLFALAWGSAWAIPLRRARTLLIATQLLSAGCLVVLHRPLAAGTLLISLIPQMALLPWTPDDLPASRFVRYTRPWLMAAMAVAALVL